MPPSRFSDAEIEAAYQLGIKTYGKNFSIRDHFVGRLSAEEQVWANRSSYLLSKGYRLRPRYMPRWTPSWLSGDDIDIEYFRYEDALTPTKADVLDAIRDDGCKVVLKCVERKSEEFRIALYVNSPRVRSDPKNHCVPVFDVLDIPEEHTKALLVMPQLIHFALLPYRRVVEVAEAMYQYIEGLDFLHQLGIIHGDACYMNLMMDGTRMVPRGVHMFKPNTHDGGARDELEWNERSTVRPLGYYLIDFGLSEMSSDIDNERWGGHYGQDHTVPEHHLPEGQWFNPVKVDIYQLGNVFVELIEDYDGLDILLGLAKLMTCQDPDARISLQEAMRWIERMDPATLSQRVWKKTCPDDVRRAIEFNGLRTTL
ncbi:hypothetical protein H0H87_001399 [Tephrocybe sp. NHM501043]|nr:hypothetical protein H0H87_001399 [Tephrocybe sp. NHM501043]